ncbi:MAG: DMT family transporter [Pseudomonadota bacterium]
MNIVYLLSALAIGVTFALQPAINAASARVLGSSFSAAVVSVAITLTTCVLLMPLFGAKLSTTAVTALPWWVVFGGLIGVGVVAGGAAIVPVTGAAIFFVCLIAGQLIGSAIADHIGVFGLAQRAITPTRVIAIGLVLCGVALLQFDQR